MTHAEALCLDPTLQDLVHERTRELDLLGAEVWFGSFGCGALVDDGRVRH